jgi:hypothetical protein
MLVFAMQLSFELQASTSYEDISTEITIDRGKPEIRQWKYEGAGRRMPAEIRASSWLSTNIPAAFELDREKLTVDLVLFSLVSFLVANEFDWQLRKRVYVGKSSGTLMTVQSVSKDSECTIISAEYLKQELSRAENAFAQAISSGVLRLPPRSTLAVTSKALVIRNPICHLRFTLESSGSVSFMKPGTGGEVPLLTSGESQLETRWVGLRVETTFCALRAQHRDTMKYRAWASRVIDGARNWFEE